MNMHSDRQRTQSATVDSEMTCYESFQLIVVSFDSKCSTMTSIGQEIRVQPSKSRLPNG